MYTIWTVFGGFILHFLLCNYLEVLLKPSYEKPVEGAAEIIKRGITPVLLPNQRIYVQLFSNSPDPVYQKLAERFYVCKDKTEYNEIRRKRKIWNTGLYAVMGDKSNYKGERFHYYSKEVVIGRYNFPGSIVNKKWPLKKVI